MAAPLYLRWMVEETDITLSDGTNIPCYRIDHTKDEDVLNEWAVHLRRHYISDELLSISVRDLGVSIAEYLEEHAIPGKRDPLACACRSGDFSEILVSDLLEFILQYRVPRIKQENRPNKDRSTQGTDVIGYKMCRSDGVPSTGDELIAAEVKGVLSTGTFDVLKKAADHSQKDEFRLGTTLDYYRIKCYKDNKQDEACIIARFQKKSEIQYKLSYAGIGVTSIGEIDDGKITQYNRDDLLLDTGHSIYLLHGDKLMDLAHDLYERCKQ